MSFVNFLKACDVNDMAGRFFSYVPGGVPSLKEPVVKPLKIFFERRQPHAAYQ